MCEYEYSNGVKCSEDPLKNSRYCALHISFEEGERLLGRKRLEELKLNAVVKKLQNKDLNLEGVYLYRLPIMWEVLNALEIEDIEEDINLSFSKIGEVIIRGSKNRPLKFKNLFIHGAEISGLYVTSAEFQNIYTMPRELYEELKKRVSKVSEDPDSFEITPELIRARDSKMLVDSKAMVDNLWMIRCNGRSLLLNGLNCSNFILANSSVDEVWMNSSKLGQVVLKDIEIFP